MKWTVAGLANAIAQNDDEVADGFADVVKNADAFNDVTRHKNLNKALEEIGKQVLG